MIQKTQAPTNTQKTNSNNHKQRSPENKDDLDSRANEEWDTKGDDVTHNKKEVHSEGKKKKD